MDVRTWIRHAVVGAKTLHNSNFVRVDDVYSRGEPKQEKNQDNDLATARKSDALELVQLLVDLRQIRPKRALPLPF